MWQSETPHERVYGLVEGRATQTGSEISQDAQRRYLETSWRRLETSDRRSTIDLTGKLFQLPEKKTLKVPLSRIILR